jgi:Spy/CpxP family protein refolding chaperone
MTRKPPALAASIILLLCAEISSAGGGRGFGPSNSARFSGKPTGGFRASLGGGGLELRIGRDLRSHRFSGRHFIHGRGFAAPRRFGHGVVVRHGGFFFGHRIIGVPSSSVVISSYPGIIAGYNPPRDQSNIGTDSLAERPLITFMLDNRHELDLSLEQIGELENLKDGYQREAIRYDADIRIAELDLQKLVRAATVDMAQVQEKLQQIERLKVELRLARIRGIEQGKTLLSPEQHGKLQTLLGHSRYSQLGDESSSLLTQD